MVLILLYFSSTEIILFLLKLILLKLNCSSLCPPPLTHFVFRFSPFSTSTNLSIHSQTLISVEFFHSSTKRDVQPQALNSFQKLSISLPHIWALEKKLVFVLWAHNNSLRCEGSSLFALRCKGNRRTSHHNLANYSQKLFSDISFFFFLLLLTQYAVLSSWQQVQLWHRDCNPLIKESQPSLTESFE